MNMTSTLTTHASGLPTIERIRPAHEAKDGLQELINWVRAPGSGVSALNVDEIPDSVFYYGGEYMLASFLENAEAAEPEMRTAMIEMAQTRIARNREFVRSLVDANNRGVGQLVDADLNEESAKLKALQTQEQLAIQALGIANSSTRNIMNLFG